MKIMKHIKTGNLYQIIKEGVINCTNAQENETMVMYSRLHDTSLTFVRETSEFNEKFEEVIPNSVSKNGLQELMERTSWL